MQGALLPVLVGEAIDDGDYRLELAHLPVKYLDWLYQTKSIPHKASKDVCSHLISALKDATTFGATKRTQTMAAAKAAIRTFKRTTDSIPAAPFSEGKWLQTPPSNVNDGIQRCIASSIS